VVGFFRNSGFLLDSKKKITHNRSKPK